MQSRRELVPNGHRRITVLAWHDQHCFIHQLREVVTKHSDAQSNTADLIGWGAEGAAGGIELP